MGVYLILDELCSSRIKDTLGHMSTPAFSVDSELLRADAFQIVVVYGVYGVLSLSSRLFFVPVPLIFQCTACLGSLLSSIRRTCPSHLSLYGPVR